MALWSVHAHSMDSPNYAIPEDAVTSMSQIEFTLETMETKLLTQLDSLLGIPYRYGSSQAQKGLDCSGLVSLVWRTLSLPTLPRTSAMMAQVGMAIEHNRLQIGDLIFFNTPRRRNSHVGVYIGNGKFIHASSVARRVMKNDLSENYYRRTYSGARRVLGPRSQDSGLSDLENPIQ